MINNCYSNFEFSLLEANYLTEFHSVLKLLTFSYEKMISEKQDICLKTSGEDPIRNLLINKYLKKYKNNFNLSTLIFKSGGEEISSTGYKTVGRLDINIENAKNLFSEESYYTIECKRLDGSTSLNKAYVQEGINRFISGKYSKTMPLAGMIGFVQKPQSFSLLISNITRHIKEPSTFLPYKIDPNFEQSYQSTHIRENSLPNIKIYHLFFDFA